MAILRRAAAILFHLLEAAALLVILHWCTTCLQPPTTPPSPPLLSRLLGIHLQPLSATSAFLLGNAIIIAILLLSVRHDPTPPPTPQLPTSPPVHGSGAHPKDLFLEPLQEDDGYYQDKAMCSESANTTAHSHATAIEDAQRCYLYWPSRREECDGDVAGGSTRRQPLLWSEADLDTYWKKPMEAQEDQVVVVMEEEKEEEEELVLVQEEEEMVEEDEKKDEFRERVEAFIGKQTSFIEREEAMLLQAAESFIL